MEEEKKKTPRIVWELGILALMFLLVFSIQFMTPVFVAPKAQFIRTYSSGSANFNLTVVTSGVSGKFSSNSYSLDIIAGEPGTTVQNSNYKLVLGSSQLIYNVGIIGPPQFFEQTAIPSDPNYTATQRYQFTAKILGEKPITSVRFILYKDSVEYANYALEDGAIDKIGDIYYASFIYLSAGNYSYQWVAKDSLNRTSADTLKPYMIKQASPGINLTLNNIEADTAVSKETNVYVKAVSANNPSLTLILLINDANPDGNPVTGIGSVEHLFNSSKYSNGVYNVKVFTNGNQNWSYQVVTRAITIASVSYSNVRSDPASGNIYQPIRTYRFLADWSGNVSNIILEFNGINYSFNRGELNKSGITYTRDFENLQAANYTYRWYGNSTIGVVSSTSQMTYEVKKAPTTARLFIGKLNENTAEASKIYTKGTVITITATIDAPGKQVLLKISKPDGNSLTNLSQSKSNIIDTVDFSGLHNITASFSGDQNYLASNAIKWIVGYDPNNPDTTQPSFIDKGQSSLKVFEKQNITIWALISDNSLIDTVKLNMNNSGSFAVLQSKFINEPVKNVSFTIEVPADLGGKTIGWSITANDSFNIITTSSISSFTVYDIADEDYSKSITISELIGVISRYYETVSGIASSDKRVTIDQVLSSISRWRKPGGRY